MFNYIVVVKERGNVRNIANIQADNGLHAIQQVERLYPAHDLPVKDKAGHVLYHVSYTGLDFEARRVAA